MENITPLNRTGPVPITPIATDVRGAAKALSVSPRTVEALAASGVVPSFRVGRRRLFSVEALRQWVQQQANAPRHDQQD